MKIYADTSVFGGVFDEEFAEDSRRFFEDLKAGKFDLVVSALVEEEIESAPRRVRAYFDELSSLAEIAEIGPEVLDLRDAHLSAGIVTRKSMDATHVALAVSRGIALVSMMIFIAVRVYFPGDVVIRQTLRNGQCSQLLEKCFPFLLPPLEFIFRHDDNRQLLPDTVR